MPNLREKSEKKENKDISIKIKVKEILERKVSKFGTGAHVIVPKEYKGKKVKIILEEGEEDE